MKNEISKTRLMELANLPKKQANIKEDVSTMSLKSNIAQTWKTADDVANDMASWLSSVYASGGEGLYDKMVNTINSAIEDFDPSY
jgi:hypothetical protein